MSLLEHARRMAAYNRWMNERLYERCATLSEEERRRDMGAFFRSVHGTLNHILLADRVWMGRFLGEPFVADSLDQELYADFATLRAEREREDARIIAWVEGLSPETLEGELCYTSMVNPEPRRYPYALTVSHFFNHQTHHRGQLTTLLMQLGHDPGVTDLIWLPEAAVGARS
ncbi:DinB family protein [Algiphilus sp.]|uniref:DinB family protein n=1 Tax=Algiphilus sp. TaxID=1872431 RepID=UPI0025BCC8F3|nr:DinB family protein [Algiphilus sp.]MCK5771122.1 damage-inducible protein DinB [Algiphilus sp.]